MQAPESTATGSVTTQPPMPFPLMRLPGELRNMIYREYFNTVSRTQDVSSTQDHEDPEDEYSNTVSSTQDASSTRDASGTQDPEDPENTEDRKDTLDALQPCLNILHANRQLRSEAASIFYQEYAGNAGGISVQPIGGSDYRWNIIGTSKEAQLQRLALFCQSLAEHGASDVNLVLRFDDIEGPQKAVTPRFVEFLTNYMVGFLCGGRQDSPVRVSSNWQRLKCEVLGTTRHCMASLSLLRSIEDGVIDMMYYYDRSTNRENFTLAGPLAKIDWSRLHEFRFPGPMEALELRGEVVIWFAEGSESRYISERTVCDSWEEPDLLSWWTNVGGPRRRARLWNNDVHAWRSLYVDSDGKAVMDDLFVLPGPRRRNSIHGYESRGSPASRSRSRSV
jgi:hypothetical protein